MKFALACFRGLVSLSILALMAVGTFGQDSKVRSDLARSFESFDLTRIAKTSAPDGARALSVKAAGRSYNLKVVANDLFSDHYRADDAQSYGILGLERPVVNTYKGKIEGLENSEVRLTIENGSVVGFFDANGDRFFVEPAKRYSDAASKDQSVVYRERDALTNQSFYCDADLPERVAYGTAAVTADPQPVVTASRRLEVATEADFEYVNTTGGAAAANSNIASILNMVEGTYAAELDLSISIVYQHTWSSPDPFAGANSGDILTNFRAYWNVNFPVSSIPRDTAHMFSGKGNILSAGIAYVGTVCNSPTSSYGVSGYVNWAPGKYLIPAHELGHNLGADHAETAQGCGNTIMNAFLSGAAQMTFCAFSRNQISSFMASNGSCLTGGSPTPTPTPTPFPTPTPTPFPTPTPTPFPTATPTPFPTATPTPFPTVTPTPFPTPTPGSTPFPTPTPRSTPRPGTTPTPFPTVTPTPFPTPFPTVTPTPAPTATPTPFPTVTPFPTPNPTPTPGATPFPTPRPRYPGFGRYDSGSSTDGNIARLDLMVMPVSGPVDGLSNAARVLAFWMTDRDAVISEDAAVPTEGVSLGAGLSAPVVAAGL